MGRDAPGYDFRCLIYFSPTGCEAEIPSRGRRQPEPGTISPVIGGWTSSLLDLTPQSDTRGATL